MKRKIIDPLASMAFHSRPAAILPSLLACDLAKLADEANRVAPTAADFVHLDVMDGHFVPNLSWGAPIIKCLKPHSKAYFDVHLMVSEPEKWVKDMAEAGADMFTFHIEATQDAPALIKAIKAAKMKAGIALKPATPASEALKYAADLDLILVMTVEPGFGGQSFMSDMMPKVAEIRAKCPDMDIEVDGGIGPANIDECAKAGANWIVAGSSVFKAASPLQAIIAMKRSVEKHGNGKSDAELTPEAN
ncbi:ribulose-phosphate 3-epimerase [Baffinella frigidus]|nr:ribulose-phosphate 3-epimerase [Cryptophyta sp. CCMP2293]|mmetsp:Transcript_5222/g.11589  ORF Transcript_5222/g.11589 Transcript_5222/m.11589 type:complete len:247 (+) Transcript_5222:1-741(+)